MRELLLLLLLCVNLTAAFAQEDGIDRELDRIKPRPQDSFAQAAAKCERLAADARQRGVRVLLIGIEGQDGFSAGNAWMVYRYLWQITHGISASPPDLDTRAPVLHRLLLPMIDSYSGRVEVLNFPETAVQEGEGGVPEACAADWLGRPDHPRLVLLGHSYGGDAIHTLALELGRRGLMVEQAFSMDPIARSPSKRFHKPANVSAWLSFIQRNEPPFGSVVVGARNRDLSPLGVNHRTIVRAPQVLAAILQSLKI